MKKKMTANMVLRMPPELHKIISEEAKKGHRSKNSMLLALIEAGLTVMN